MRQPTLDKAATSPTAPETVKQRPRIMRWAGAENVFAALVFAALFYVPYLVGGYPVYILPQYMLFGVLALTLCLLWGFGGMVSFGQGAFFAVGAYAFGIVLKNMDGPSAPWVGLVLGVVLGALIAGAVGYFLFSANVRDSYFVLVTLAISTIVYVIANSQSGLTGGFNGMYVDRATLSVFGLFEISLAGDLAMYYVAFAVTLLCVPRLSVSAVVRVRAGSRQHPRERGTHQSPRVQHGDVQDRRLRDLRRRGSVGRRLLRH